jgi:osmotically-inducible protein OsmY
MHTNGIVSESKARLARPGESRADDVGHRVLDNLRTSNYPGLRRIKVEVHGNTVTLRGQLGSYHERQVAIARVVGVRGVSRVVDRLSLPPE